MKTLAAKIRRDLETETAQIGHCAIYENDLERLRQQREENGKAKIGQFAKEFESNLRLL